MTKDIDDWLNSSEEDEEISQLQIGCRFPEECVIAGEHFTHECMSAKDMEDYHSSHEELLTTGGETSDRTNKFKEKYKHWIDKTRKLVLSGNIRGFSSNSRNIRLEDRNLINLFCHVLHSDHIDGWNRKDLDLKNHLAIGNFMLGIAEYIQLLYLGSDETEDLLYCASPFRDPELTEGCMEWIKEEVRAITPSPTNPDPHPTLEEISEHQLQTRRTGNIRQQLSKEDLEKAIAQATQAVYARLNQKGWGTFSSNHEILGALEEEMYEYKKAVHEGLTTEERIGELVDIAVAAIVGVASIQSGGIDY